MYGKDHAQQGQIAILALSSAYDALLLAQIASWYFRLNPVLWSLFLLTVAPERRGAYKSVVYNGMRGFRVHAHR